MIERPIGRPPINQMTCNAAGIAIIKRFESLHDGDKSTPVLEPQMCPKGIWTVGYGHALTYKTGGFIMGKANKPAAYLEWRRRWPNGMTEGHAEALLRADVEIRENACNRAITVPVNTNQFSALVSLTYNIGAQNLLESTLLRKLNSRDYAGAAKEFLKWNKMNQNGVLVALPGLTTRRVAEQALFLRNLSYSGSDD